MNLIMHIGMGKTGSSAIQAALAASSDRLAAQRAKYLGMWFDMVDPRFRGVQSQDRFFNLPPREMVSATEALIEVLRSHSVAGMQTFILSNEAFSGKSRQLKPMIDCLRRAGITLHVIGYARHPAAWLTSAYVQWGVRDKVEPGPVPPYAVKARALVGWYTGLLDWHRLMSDVLDVRSYDQASDIVIDFSEATGLELDIPVKRVLERGEDAEIVLRALFNNRFPKHVLPIVFERAVLRDLTEVPQLEDVVKNSLDYSETEAIIEEQAELFKQFTATFGFDPREIDKSPPPIPNIENLRSRLLDALLEITLDQAQRIRRIENRLRQLESSSRT